MKIPPEDVLVVRVKPTSFSFYVSVIDEQLKGSLDKKEFSGASNVGGNSLVKIFNNNSGDTLDNKKNSFDKTVEREASGAVQKAVGLDGGGNKEELTRVKKIFSDDKDTKALEVGAIQLLSLSTGPINLVDASSVGEFFEEYLKVGASESKRYYSKVYALQATKMGPVRLNGKPLEIVMDQKIDDPLGDSEFLSIVSRVYLLSQIRLARERMRVALNAHFATMKGQPDV